MANDKVQLTIKKADSKKPSLEDMYLIEQPIKMSYRIKQYREQMEEAGEDTSDMSNGYIRNILLREEGNYV